MVKWSKLMLTDGSYKIWNQQEQAKNTQNKSKPTRINHK